MRLFYTLVFMAFFAITTAKAQNQFSAQQFAKLKAATFKDVEGKEFTLAQYKGKVVIVDFWETWCGPCVHSMPAVEKIATQYKDKIVIVAADALMKDSEEAFKHFTVKHPNLLQYATSNQLLKILDVHFIPFKVFIDADGNYVNAYESAQEKVEDEYQEMEIILKKIMP